MTRVFQLHPGLADCSRLNGLTRTDNVPSATELLTLMFVGIVAGAVSTLVDLHLRIPGHAILKVFFPVAAGMALVPRRGAGSVSGTFAVLTAVSLRLAGLGGSGLSFGALTSLALIGPMLDWTLQRARSSRSVYLGFILAGLATNVIALLVRGTLKTVGFEHVGGRPLAMWLGQAVLTYPLCGIAAGLLSAFVWFCVRPRTRPNEEEPAS